MEPVSLWLHLRDDPRVLPRVHYWAYMRVIERIRHNRVTDGQDPLRHINGVTARFAMGHINA
ncbi:unnamed protein product [marine sediment metagenome]|uniref:Uncharacterized protein n=1 Tax=marine sediment metagenome TaxID=412755 RepID=X0YVR0_9ZZZZ